MDKNAGRERNGGGAGYKKLYPNRLKITSNFI
jgi:hypothetical protein